MVAVARHLMVSRFGGCSSPCATRRTACGSSATTPRRSRSSRTPWPASFGDRRCAVRADRPDRLARRRGGSCRRYGFLIGVAIGPRHCPGPSPSGLGADEPVETFPSRLDLRAGRAVRRRVPARRPRPTVGRAPTAPVARHPRAPRPRPGRRRRWEDARQGRGATAAGGSGHRPGTTAGRPRPRPGGRREPVPAPPTASDNRREARRTKLGSVGAASCGDPSSAGLNWAAGPPSSVDDWPNSLTSAQLASFQRVHHRPGVDLTVTAGDLRFLIGPNGATIVDAITGLATVRLQLGASRLPREEDAPHRAGGRRAHVPDRERLRGAERAGRPDIARAGPAHAAAPRPRPPRPSSRRWKPVGLAHLRDVQRIAHGQKQWLEIGMLLVQDARLLLLDKITRRS